MVQLDSSPEQSGDNLWMVPLLGRSLFHANKCWCLSNRELAILAWRHVHNKFIDSVHAWQVKVVRKSKHFLWENERALKHKITVERLAKDSAFIIWAYLVFVHNRWFHLFGLFSRSEIVRHKVPFPKLGHVFLRKIHACRFVYSKWSYCAATSRCDCSTSSEITGLFIKRKSIGVVHNDNSPLGCGSVYLESCCK